MSRTRQDTRTGKPPKSRAFVGVKVLTKSKDDKIVKKVMTLEPTDRNSVSQKKYINNLYCELISELKRSTQEYYNMRMGLGLEPLLN